FAARAPPKSLLENWFEGAGSCEVFRRHRLRKPSVSYVHRPTLNSKTQDSAYSLSTIGRSVWDVRCSAFRADLRFQTFDLWMKSFLKYWLALPIWLSVIFVGSTNLMSAEHTSRFVVPFLLWLKPGMSPHTIWVILVLIRKCAHVTEYAVLALLLWRALRSIPILRAKM